jgi:hypothetical protein
MGRVLLLKTPHLKQIHQASIYSYEMKILVRGSHGLPAWQSVCLCFFKTILSPLIKFHQSPIITHPWIRFGDASHPIGDCHVSPLCVSWLLTRPDTTDTLLEALDLTKTPLITVIFGGRVIRVLG